MNNVVVTVLYLLWTVGPTPTNHLSSHKFYELLLPVASNRLGHCQFSYTGISSSRKQGSLNDHKSF